MLSKINVSRPPKPPLREGCQPQKLKVTFKPKVSYIGKNKGRDNTKVGKALPRTVSGQPHQSYDKIVRRNCIWTT